MQVFTINYVPGKESKRLVSLQETWSGRNISVRILWRD